MPTQAEYDAVQAAFTTDYIKDPAAAQSKVQSGGYSPPGAAGAADQLNTQRQYTAGDSPVPLSKFNADAYSRNKAINLFDTTGKYASVDEAQKAFTGALNNDGAAPYQHYLDFGYSEGINPGLLETTPSLPPAQTPAAKSFSTYGTEYVNPQSMASTQAANILKAGSPLLEAAQGYATQQSNGRGLANTSIGVSAGTGAVTNVAADLGKDQANVYSAAQAASQGHDYTSDLSSQNAGQTKELTTLQGNITSNLSAQNAAQTSVLSEQNAGQTKDLTTLQGNITADNASKIATLTASLTQANQEKQNEFTKALTELGYDNQKTQLLASIVSNQSTAFMNNVASLLNNTDIEMGDNVTKWLTDAMYASWDTSASLLKQDISVV